MAYQIITGGCFNAIAMSWIAAAAFPIAITVTLGAKKVLDLIDEKTTMMK